MFVSLCHAKDSLETIWLDIEQSIGIQDVRDGIPSFVGFTALKYLHINGNMLSALDPWADPIQVPIFRDILPSTIKKLHITDIDEDVADELAMGLEDHILSALNHTPDLKEIILKANLDNASFDNVRHACAEAIIHFRIQKGRRNNDWAGDEFEECPFPSDSYSLSLS